MQERIDTMANKNGLTIKQGFERALEMYRQIGDAEMVAFFEKRLEQEVKKANSKGERKPTAHQNENAQIKIGILQNMKKGNEYSIPEMLIEFDCFPNGMTSRRLASLLTQLGAKGSKQIKRIEKKDRVYYALA